MKEKQNQAIISKRTLLEYQDPQITKWVVKLDKVEKEIKVLRSEVNDMICVAYQAPTKLCDRIQKGTKKFEELFAKCK